MQAYVDTRLGKEEAGGDKSSRHINKYDDRESKKRDKKQEGHMGSSHVRFFAFCRWGLAAYSFCWKYQYHSG